MLESFREKCGGMRGEVSYFQGIEDLDLDINAHRPKEAILDAARAAQCLCDTRVSGIQIAQSIEIAKMEQLLKLHAQMVEEAEIEDLTYLIQVAINSFGSVCESHKQALVKTRQGSYFNKIHGRIDIAQTRAVALDDIQINVKFSGVAALQKLQLPPFVAISSDEICIIFKEMAFPLPFECVNKTKAHSVFSVENNRAIKTRHCHLDFYSLVLSKNKNKKGTSAIS